MEIFESRGVGLSERLRRLARSRVGVGLRVTLSVAIIAWFALRIDYQKLGAFAHDIRPVYIASLVALALFRMWISAARFRLLSNLIVPIPFRTLLKQYFVASYFNNLLPTALGGDVVRLLLLARVGLPKQQGAVFILAERGMGVMALAMLALLGVLTYPIPAAVRAFVAVLVVGMIALTIALWRFRDRAGTVAERLPAMARAIRAVGLLAARPDVLARVLVASLVFQAASVALSWTVALGLGVEVSFRACLALVPLVWIVTLLPVSIGGIGLREASFAYLFGLIGIPTEASLMISLGTFAALLFTGAIGGLLFLHDSVARRAVAVSGVDGPGAD